jgi:hypothetical protein
MTMTTQNKKDNALANTQTQIEELSAIERVVVQGDLSPLTAAQRVTYYRKVCESAGLNPFTKPFEYIMLNGKLTLYAKKDCTEQLRKLNGISITSLDDKMVDDLYIVTAKACTKDGRTDQAKGAVVIGHLKGEQKANAIMKAETKAKRRVTLSISGMGFSDESEIDSIPNAVPMELNLESGELKKDEPYISESQCDELDCYFDLCSPEYQEKFNAWLKDRKKINSISTLPESCYENVKKRLLEQSTEYQRTLVEVKDA